MEKSLNEKQKIIKNLIIIFIISICLEVMVFNITSYRVLMGKFEKKEINNGEFLQFDDDRAIIKFSNLNVPIASIKIIMSNIKWPTEYKISYSDETSSQYKYLNSKKYIESYEKSKYMPLYLSGNTNGLIVNIDKEIYEDGNFHGIVLNEKIPFEFNFVRLIITFFIIASFYLLKNLNLFNQVYSTQNMKQEVVLLIIVAIFLSILTFINITSENKFESTVYNKSFVNAIESGNLYLNEEPSKEFLELEDPYDDLTRSSLKRGVDFLWDTAYYNGKQYVYFGILPVLLLFLPFHLLTGTYLKISIVVFGFSILVILLLKEILIKIINMFFEKVKFKVVVYSLITLCAGSMLFYLNGMSRVYELVIVAGMYFVLQGLYFILNSIQNEDRKYLNLFLGCMFLALSVACRPTDLFASLLIVPYCLKLFIEKIKNVKEEKLPLFKLIISIGVPYITVGIALMYYNYIRFDNPFEFGTKYQLTIMNMAKLGSRLFVIPVRNSN